MLRGLAEVHTGSVKITVVNQLFQGKREQSSLQLETISVKDSYNVSLGHQDHGQQVALKSWTAKRERRI